MKVTIFALFSCLILPYALIAQNNETGGSQVEYKVNQKESDEGFQVLFDGTTLSNWIGNSGAYTISEEGTLAVIPKDGSGGNLFSKEIFSDFIFRFSFRLTPGANNGIAIRAPLNGEPSYDGMEIQILDNAAEKYRSLEAYQYHGSLYGVIPAKQGFLRSVGEWNEQEVIVKGDTISVALNGTVILNGNLARASEDGTLDGKEHPGITRRDGHVGFLGHGSEVHFKNIRIKRL